MRLNEAHYWLEEKQRMMTQYRHLFSSEDVEANGMAILALEKQVTTETIHDAPTIETEPVRHGHWITFNKVYDKCSICGNLHHYSESYGYYCQHCGAKMEDYE